MLKSIRLQTIASMVPQEVKVFDIGCDHGLLSLHLYVENKNQVVATDITSYSVEKTKTLVESKKCPIEVIHTDGLQGLDIRKEDYIIIAGMGTSTILTILMNNQELISNHLILASHNDYPLLRKKMNRLGYKICREKVVLEHNKYYIIIKYEKGRQFLTKTDYLLGPIIRHENKDYLSFLLKQAEDIYKKIPETRKTEIKKSKQFQALLKRAIKKIR